MRVARRGAISRAVQADDDEQRGLSRRVVRVRSAQGDEVGERHHRHVPRAALARDRRTCCCITTWARSTARFARGDFRSGGTGAISESIASAARAFGAEIRTDAARRRACSCSDGRATGVALDERRRDRARRSSCRGSIRGARSSSWSTASELPDDLVERRRALQVPRLVGQGESRAERSAELHLPDAPATGADDSRGARRVLDQPERRVSRARVRRRQVRRVLATPVHGHRDSVDDRSRAWRRRAST